MEKSSKAADRRPGPSPARKALARLISARRAVQISFGVALWFAVAELGVSLWTVILAGSALGVLFGKFFCRWMCPMGAVMETMLGAGDPEGKQRSLYNYFKLGCPIAWAGGLLNRFSLGRVKVDAARCTGCNRCDEACYVAQLSPGHSLHRAGSRNASTHYSCSRCLGCVGACPTGALTYGASLGGSRAIAAGPEATKKLAKAGGDAKAPSGCRSCP